MQRIAFFLLFLSASLVAQSPLKPAQDQAWIATSNSYTQKLLDIQARYVPEEASAQGLTKFDDKVTDPSLAAQNAHRRDDEAVVAQLIKAKDQEKNPNVIQDLNILIHAKQLEFRRSDFERDHMIPYVNATSAVYNGLRVLLDEQNSSGRRRVANDRMKRYVGLDPDPGGNRMTEIPNMGRNASAVTGLANSDHNQNAFVVRLIARMSAQMAKPNMIYPSRGELESQLSRNAAIVKGISDLFAQYKLSNWEPTFEILHYGLVYYDNWVRTNLLPKARPDFRLPPEEYAFNLAEYGVDLPPDQLAVKAHAAFSEYQAQMQPLAADIARQHGWPSTDYRDVIRELKKQQLVGDSILPFYEKRLAEMESIIREKQLVSMPTRPAIIRLATAAETAQQPAPHMDPPPFLHNTGQRGVFILPLNAPAGPGQSAVVKTDDFTFDAASWTLIAHEARPGHELQFDSMVERGVSQARALYAFNSTNAEGWGLYAEYLMLPFMPKEGQLISLQLRLMRAARAFLDPELQAGKIKPADAMKVLTADVCLSSPFANSEVERYTVRAPGQADSYFYGYTRLLELRKQTEAALGPKFNQLQFHDFILAQGLLPPDLMKLAVETQFIPAAQAR